MPVRFADPPTLVPAVVKLAPCALHEGGVHYRVIAPGSIPRSLEVHPDGGIVDTNGIRYPSVPAFLEHWSAVLD